MAPDELAQLAAAMGGIARLELTGPGVRVVLGRSIGSPAEPPEAAPIRVLAPGVGRFLRTHPLHERPLAGDGDRVAAGQAIALLQVGPLLLPVVAPAPVAVAEAVAADGTLVGYGDPLFAVLPQD